MKVTTDSGAIGSRVRKTMFIEREHWKQVTQYEDDFRKIDVTCDICHAATLCLKCGNIPA